MKVGTSRSTDSRRTASAADIPPYLNYYEQLGLTPNVAWRIDLQPEELNANIDVFATQDIVVQLVVDDGRLNAMTILPYR